MISLHLSLRLPVPKLFTVTGANKETARDANRGTIGRLFLCSRKLKLDPFAATQHRWLSLAVLQSCRDMALERILKELKDLHKDPPTTGEEAQEVKRHQLSSKIMMLES
ncbi:uncharacterized protein DS421_2g53900 [Arachis hypogaea]|nr:uncharacterized protein DS421_2g53900 [Arachis hypogaea]